MTITDPAQGSPEPETDAPVLIPIDEVARRLGVEVRHVRRLVYEERIPYIKWGLNLHFDLDEIDAWIDQHRRPARRSS